MKHEGTDDFSTRGKGRGFVSENINDHWACEKLQETFCNCLFCNDDSDAEISPAEFSLALFNAYTNRDLSAFLMGICQNTLFDLLRNSFLIPYRFDADGKQNPVIMTDENGQLLPAYKGTAHEKNTGIFMRYTKISAIRKYIFCTGIPLQP